MASAKRVGEQLDTRDVQLTLSLDEAKWLGNLLGNIGYPNNHLNNIYTALRESAGVYWHGLSPFIQHTVDLKKEQ